MAYNQELTDRVRNMLAAVPDAAEKKMFGSVGFMVGGKLCIGVGDHPGHVMMVRVGSERYGRSLAKARRCAGSHARAGDEGLRIPDCRLPMQLRMTRHCNIIG